MTTAVISTGVVDTSPALHIAVKYKATNTHMNFAAKILLRAYSDLVAGAESRILWVARTGQ